MEWITRKGIDVSKYQGNVNWRKVKNSGIEFVILRAGYGKNTVDECFVRNIKECIKYGFDIGVYWFIYGINELEAIQNANMCHSVISPYKDKINMKVWCDLEYDTETKANKKGVIFTKELRTNMVKAFCERMKSYGYEVGNYTNQDYLKNKFGDLSMYPLWLAKYSSSKGNCDCELWQYTSKGRVDGIKGNVDMNYHYVQKNNNIPTTTPSSTLSINQFAPLKGNSTHFAEIVKNIKLALNTDYGLAFTIDSGINDILLINLANVVLSTSVYKPNITYALQQLFVWWGYDLKIDGIYGNGTKSTVTLFQSQVGIPQTGTTTKEFWHKILGK